MKTFDVAQGSPAWIKLRMGIPTASELDALVSPTLKIRTGEGPQTYLYQKLCCAVTGIPPDDFQSFAMGQGSILEHEAVPWFEFTHEAKVERVGFCTTDDGRVGCSPDGLLGSDGGIEIKCPRPETHLKYLLEGTVPTQYLAQIHTSMLVTGRRWWNFLSYSRQFPALLLRVEYSQEWQDTIRKALDGFYEKFTPAFQKITAMRDSENSAKEAAYNEANPNR